MARDHKAEVAAVNIRIPEDRGRDYAGLIGALAETKKSVRVRGDTFLAIKSFDLESHRGVIAKFTEIDRDGDWFDLDVFDTATPDKVQGIEIPAALRPNLSQFYFILSAEDHLVVFESYSEGRTLSPRAVEKFFRTIFLEKPIVGAFGPVEADVIKDYDEIEKILDDKKLRELTMIVRPPNSDDVGDDLAKVIEERLREQNGGEYEERIKALPGENLEPNERTRKLAFIAAENGKVEAKAVKNRVLSKVATSEKPLLEADKFDEDTSSSNAVTILGNRLIGKVRAKRQQVRE